MLHESNGYVRDLCEVTEVKETEDMREVNGLIRNGWMLLGVVSPSRARPDIVRFSLGKIARPVNVAN